MVLKKINSRKPSELQIHSFGSVDLFYHKYYAAILFGGNVGSWFIKKTHETMETPFIGMHFPIVLEIGGGNGEHLGFIKHGYEKYYLTDLIKPKIKNKTQKIICEVQNAEFLRYQNEKFDRVISTCLLHHVSNPEKVLSEMLRVVKTNGVITIFLSCDPGLAVRALRSITTARNAKQMGFTGFKLLNARDHRNHVGSLIQIIGFVFRNEKVKIKYFPFLLKSWNLNGFITVNITKH
jgi:ubiquinone/menaquinone biosynthesis C-methylase UbiE